MHIVKYKCYFTNKMIFRNNINLYKKKRRYLPCTYEYNLKIEIESNNKQLMKNAL